MTLTPVEMPKFGGLNLSGDPQEVGVSAIDCLNVMVDRDGRLRSRDGYAAFSNVIIGYTPLIAKYVYSGSTPAPQIVFICRDGSGKLAYQALTQGAIGAGFSRTATAGTFGWVAVVGDTTNNRIFYSTDGFADLYYDQTGVVTGVGGGPLGVQPLDNRLVAASGSKVSFSDAGAPTTFGTNNFVYLTPGDGEIIREIVAWQNFLFVFKQTKFFVFYGNSIDGAGNPVFNYRTVSAGQGVRDPQGAIATPEGVYFVNDAGVWLTTGGTATRISKPLDALFQQTTSPYVSSSVTNITASGTRLRLANARNQLYVYTDAGTLAFDRQTGAWTAHSIDPTCATGFDTTHATPVPDGTEDLFFCRAGTAPPIYRLSSASTQDAGAGITSRYRTGFWNPGQPAAESVVREWLIDGSGTPTWKTAVNDIATLGTGATVTLGTAPVISQGRDRRSTRGRNVSFEISGTSPWSVSRVVANLRGQRNAGLQAT